jgi:hypothetical protein
MRLSEGESLQALERLDGSLEEEDAIDPASPPVATGDPSQPDANA